MTKDLPHEEMADMLEAKKKLEVYEDVHEIYEYATDLNECIQVLEGKITTNNPIVPMNLYRQSEANEPQKLFAEMETYL